MLATLSDSPSNRTSPMLALMVKTRSFHVNRKSLTFRSNLCATLSASFRTVLQQNAELVAAETRERIALPHLLVQQHRQLSQQLVAGRMAAGIVDDLELIEIEIQQSVLPCRFGPEEQLAQALLEGAPVVQSGERIVRCLVGHFPGESSLLADVVKHDHRAEHFAVATANRRDRLVDGDLLLRAVHEQAVTCRCLGRPGDHRWVVRRPHVKHLGQLTAACLDGGPAGQYLGRRIDRDGALRRSNVLEICVGAGVVVVELGEPRLGLAEAVRRVLEQFVDIDRLVIDLLLEERWKDGRADPGALELRGGSRRCS